MLEWGGFFLFDFAGLVSFVCAESAWALSFCAVPWVESKGGWFSIVSVREALADYKNWQRKAGSSV